MSIIRTTPVIFLKEVIFYHCPVLNNYLGKSHIPLCSQDETLTPQYNLLDPSQSLSSAFPTLLSHHTPSTLT